MKRARYHVAARVAAAARLERYSDPEQAIVTTGQPFGLRATGASFNVDVEFAPRVLRRTELRALRSPDPLFTHGGVGVGTSSGQDIVLVTSAALTF